MKRRVVLLLCLFHRSAAFRGSCRINPSFNHNLHTSLFHRRNSYRRLSLTTSYTSIQTLLQSQQIMHNLNTSNNLDKKFCPTGEYGSIERLCSVSLRGCQLLTPLISAIYEQLLESLKSSDSTSSSTVQKEKKDNSAFTIADGLVQRLLIQVLFKSVTFKDIVGEEDEEDGNKGEDDDSWYKVEGLDVPHDLRPLVDSTRSDIESLAQEHLSTNW